MEPAEESRASANASGDTDPDVAPAREPETDETLEVSVRGETRPPGSASLSPREVRTMPGAFGDPFRAIEALPGVTPMASGVPYFFVRGAPPGNVGYTLDDIEIPLLFHVGAGPGVVHPSLIRDVDLHPGGYPARYGRFSGGMVTATTAAPRAEAHGEANIRVFDAGALVEAPWAEGRGTALVAGRYSYTAAILSLVSPDVELGYWDYQARASYDVTRDDRLSVFAFGSGDTLADASEDPDELLFDTTFHRIDLRYDRAFPDEGGLGLRVLFGADENRGEGGRLIEGFKLGARMTVERRLSDDVLFRAGTDVAVDRYETEFILHPCLAGLECPDVVRDVALTSDQLDLTLSELFPSRTDLETGVWTDLVLDLGAGSTLVPGLRVDLYTSQGEAAVGVDPRLSMRVAAGGDVYLVPSVGIAHQLPGFLPGPGFQVAGIRGGLQRSVQSSWGVESDLPLDISGRVTVFRNVTFGLTDPLGTTRGAGLGVDRFTNRSTGETLGLEVFLRRPITRTIGGFFSYTLSRSTRTFEGTSLPSAYDRTHVLSAALSYDLGRRWTAGTRTVFYTGFPEDEVNIFRDREAAPQRTLPFFRLDLRLAKDWIIAERYRVALVFEILNALFRSEVFDVECYPEECRSRTIGPVTIPSIGVEAAF